MNLIDMLMKLLGSGNIMSQLSGLLGESPEKAKSALGAALPTVLAGLAGTAATPDGARRLNEAVDKADDGILGNLGGLLGGGGTQAINAGSDVLGSLLGGGSSTLGTLGSLLGRFSGVNAGGMGKLLALLAPVVLGFLKKQKGSLGLDAGGLANLLAGQKDNIAAAMPSGLMQALGSAGGIGSVGSMAQGLLGSAGRGAAAAADAATGGAKSALSWLLPVVVLVALGFLLWRFLAPAASTVSTTAQQAGSAVSDAARSVVDSAPNLLGDAQKQVTSLFDGMTQTLGGITDAASADAALPKLKEFAGNVDGLDKLLGALPAEARGTVTSLIGSSYGKLQQLIDKVLAIPGVGDKLRPVIDPMTARLKALAGK